MRHSLPLMLWESARRLRREWRRSRPRARRRAPGRHIVKLGGKMMLKSGIGAVALTSILLSSAAWAQEKIKVGVTATLEGTYTILGVDGIAGFNAAVKKYGPKAGGKELEFVVAS